jgi:hypothetical protein
VFIVDGIPVLFLLQGIHGAEFFSRPKVFVTTRTQIGVKLLKPHTSMALIRAKHQRDNESENPMMIRLQQKKV